jgi:hypothetical protein
MPSIISGNDNFNSSAAVGTRGQVFTSNGTFTLPAGVSAVKVTVVGGGGNSGAAPSSGNCGMGGGGGGAAIKYLSGLTSGNTLAVTVGGAGGTSSVASGTQSITTISATGGATGVTAAADRTNPTLGGSGSNGDINITGGSSSSIARPTGAILMSTGGISIFGGYQGLIYSTATTDRAGIAGITYGCGGTGPFKYLDAFNGVAAAGFQGVVIFEW